MHFEFIKKKINYYLDNNWFFSAMLYCEKLVNKDNSQLSRFQYADVLRLCGFFSKSEAIFMQIDIEDIPDNYKYIYHLYFARLLMDMNKVEEAKNQLKTCMEFENCDTSPYIYMADLLRDEKNNDEAIFFLQKALEKQGDTDEVYYNLATRYANKGNINMAIKMINNCLDLDPSYPNAMNMKKDFQEFQAIQNLSIE